MASYFPFMLTINLFLASVIFIIAAYLLQVLSRMNNWESGFLIKTKTALTGLSIISTIISVFMYISLHPF